LWQNLKQEKPRQSMHTRRPRMRLCICQRAGHKLARPMPLPTTKHKTATDAMMKIAAAVCLDPFCTSLGARVLCTTKIMPTRNRKSPIIITASSPSARRTSICFVIGRSCARPFDSQNRQISGSGFQHAQIPIRLQWRTPASEQNKLTSFHGLRSASAAL